MNGPVKPAKRRLIIKYFGNPAEDYCDLEQARYILNFEIGMIVADGQKVQSYADLVALAGRDKYQDKKDIEIMVLPTIMGG